MTVESGEDIVRAGARLPPRQDGPRHETPLRSGRTHAQVGRYADERDSPEAIQ